MSYLSPTLTLLVNAVKRATASLDRDFSEIEKMQSSVRNYQTFVTRSYDKVEQILKIELSRVRSDAIFVENNQPTDKGSCFLINPLDGMGNFVRGIALFATTVAYCENGEVKACVIYNRASDELYFAEKGNGAYKEGFRNHERLRVSATKEGNLALVAANVGYEHGSEEYTVACRDIFAETNNVRMFGAISLEMAAVASGKLDVSLSLGGNINSVAAGLLLVREAGGYVYDLKREKIVADKVEQALLSSEIAAANPLLESFIVHFS